MIVTKEEGAIVVGELELAAFQNLAVLIIEDGEQYFVF